MDYKDRERGNWAFIQLRKAYTLLVEYETSHLIDKGEIPREESGPRLYMASIGMATVMEDLGYFLDWADEKISESQFDHLEFFEYRWGCRADVERTLFDISRRIFSSLAPNFKKLLNIKREAEGSQSAVLSEFREALQVKGKSISLHCDPPIKELDFLLNVVERLFIRYCLGEQKDGALKKGVMKRERNGAAKGFGLTIFEAEKAWNRNREWLHRRSFTVNDTTFVLFLEGRSIRFLAPPD